MHRYLIIILFFASLASVKAATINAASVSRADQSTAFGLASSGDTVNIPSGSATFSSALTVPAGVTVIGAGTNSTILTTAGSGIYTLSQGAKVSDMKVVASGGTTSDWFFQPSGTNQVVDRVTFDCTAVSGANSVLMAIYDQQQNVSPNGVLKRCLFRDTRIVINSPYIDGMHIRWAQPTAMGTQNAWYIEDCIFEYINTGHTAIDAQYGGAYVARYTTFSNCFPSMHNIQTGNGRGARFWEIYECDFIGGEQPNAASATSTGVFYNNNADSALHVSERVLTLGYARAYEAVGTGGKADGHSNWDGNTALYSGTHTGANNAATLTDGTKSWSVNQFVISGWSRWIYNVTDGSKVQITANTATTATGTLTGGSQNDWDTGDVYLITDGWPARDQPGAGKDAVTWPSPYAGAAPAQASEPIYIWGNTGFATPLVNINDQGQPQSEQLIQEGRDYIYEEHPTYTALAYPHPLLSEEGGGGGDSTTNRANAKGNINFKSNILFK